MRRLNSSLKSKSIGCNEKSGVQIGANTSPRSTFLINSLRFATSEPVRPPPGSKPLPDQRQVVRADCVVDSDVNSVARNIRMVSVQAVYNGEQVCTAVGETREKSACLATWMDECNTEVGAVHSLHTTVMYMEVA
jgi:hypothetical protein